MAGWFRMENPIKMDDLGGKPTIFGNIHMGLPYMILQGGHPKSAHHHLGESTLYPHPSCRPEDCESWSCWKVEISGTSWMPCMRLKKIGRFMEKIHQPGDSSRHDQPLSPPSWRSTVTTFEFGARFQSPSQKGHHRRTARSSYSSTSKRKHKWEEKVQQNMPICSLCFGASQKLGNLPRNSKNFEKITTIFVQGLFYFGLWLLGA